MIDFFGGDLFFWEAKNISVERLRWPRWMMDGMEKAQRKDMDKIDLLIKTASSY